MGVLGLATHALVDFPLQIYPIALGAVGLIALRISAFQPPQLASPRRTRRLLLLATASQLPLAVWQLHATRTEQAATAILDQPPGAIDDAQWLQRWAPWRPEWRLSLAWRAQLDGDEPAAVGAAMDAIQRHPGDGSTLRRSAMILARFGHLDPAEDAFAQATTRGPTDYRSWASWSAIHRDSDPQRAAELWARGLVHWPYDPMSRGEPLRAGYAAFPIGLWWLDAVEPAPAWWSERLGALMMEVGDAGTALVAYEQAARLDPVYQAWPPRARAMVAIGDVDAADAYLEAMIRLDPNQERPWLVWADLLLAQGRGEEARSAYKQALRIVPSRSRSKVGLVRSATLLEGPEAGFDEIARLRSAGQLEVVPEVRLEEARLHAKLESWESCVRVLEEHRVVKSPSLREAALALKGRCLEAQGK